MRLSGLAAGIFSVALTGYAAFTAVPSVNSAAPAFPVLARPASFLKVASGTIRASQQQEPQSQQPLQVTTNVVNVFATVRDKHHGIISDLTKEDFKIFEDGQEQKISFFSKEVDMPITLGS